MIEKRSSGLPQSLNVGFGGRRELVVDDTAPRSSRRQGANAAAGTR